MPQRVMVVVTTRQYDNTTLSVKRLRVHRRLPVFFSCSREMSMPLPTRAYISSDALISIHHEIVRSGWLRFHDVMVEVVSIRADAYRGVAALLCIDEAGRYGIAWVDYGACDRPEHARASEIVLMREGTMVSDCFSCTVFVVEFDVGRVVYSFESVGNDGRCRRIASGAIFMQRGERGRDVVYDDNAIAPYRWIADIHGRTGNFIVSGQDEGIYLNGLDGELFPLTTLPVPIGTQVIFNPSGEIALISPDNSNDDILASIIDANFRQCNLGEMSWRHNHTGTSCFMIATLDLIEAAINCQLNSVVIPESQTMNYIMSPSDVTTRRLISNIMSQAGSSSMHHDPAEFLWTILHSNQLSLTKDEWYGMVVGTYHIASSSDMQGLVSDAIEDMVNGGESLVCERGHVFEGQKHLVVQFPAHTDNMLERKQGGHILEMTEAIELHGENGLMSYILVGMVVHLGIYTERGHCVSLVRSSSKEMGSVWYVHNDGFPAVPVVGSVEDWLIRNNALQALVWYKSADV